MKKRSPASKVEDQVCPTGYRVQPRNRQPDAKEIYGDKRLATPQLRVSYILRRKVRKEPSEVPRLFIRGLYGGSIKMDLLGLNVGLSEAAFAFWVPDESFERLHIHHGDIVIVDPTRPLRTGDLILLQINGQEILGRLYQEKGLWFVESAVGSGTPPTPLYHQSVGGVVLGVLRLFSKVTPICYPGTEANLRGSFERSACTQSAEEHRRTPAATTVRPRKRYPKRKPSPFLLAAGPEKPYAASKGRKKVR